jgi:hypothetical protein
MVFGLSMGTMCPLLKEREASSAPAGSTPITRHGRLQGLCRHRDATELATAADGTQDDVQVRMILQELHRRGALSRHHEQIVVGMHERRARFGDHAFDRAFASFQGRLAEDDLPPYRLTEACFAFGALVGMTMCAVIPRSFAARARAAA